MDVLSNAKLNGYEDLGEMLALERMGRAAFPFNSSLSFEPFLEALKAKLPNAPESEQLIIQLVLDQYESIKKEHGPLSEENLGHYTPLFSSTLPGFLPSFNDQQIYGFFAKPFSNIPIFASEGFKALMTSEEMEISFNMDSNTLQKRMISNASSHVLNTYYDQKFKPALPTVISFRDTETQLEKHYRLQVTTDFVNVKALTPPKELSEEEIRELILNPDNVELWQEKIPEENFEFYGFTFVNFMDATEAEILSNLKNEMLRKDTSSPVHGFEYATRQIRSFFGNKDLSIGLTAFEMGLAKLIYDLYGICTSILDKDIFKYKPQSIIGSIYHESVMQKKPIIIEDTQKWPNQTKVEKKLIEENCRSLILFPLENEQGRITNFIELISPNPNDFDFYSLTKMQQLIPLLTAAFEAEQNQIIGNMTSVIQEHFTNIHPSVGWKFRDAAIQYIRQSQEKSPNRLKIAPIVFNNIYPIYGQADIVKSSMNRNKAIQTDLVDNLGLLGNTLSQMSSYAHTHLMDYFRVKVQTVREELLQSFSPSDETRVLDLLRSEIHPCLERIMEESSRKEQEPLKNYFNQLNPTLGVIYNHRKNFEQSVAMINDNISLILSEEDEKMQKMLPHYFEKYKTDGVEFNIYLGQSLLDDKTYTDYHLKNFRLWQLITMCRITQKVAELQESMPQPLTTAQLIFVYSDSLDIRFRMDEKHFDVDGAYNVRYEIIKKRIDKAYVEGTDERLTQSGKIAIVYLHRKDRIEYLEYLNYLVQIGLITDNIEHLRLGKLQGVEGLKALRITAKV